MTAATGTPQPIRARVAPAQERAPVPVAPDRPHRMRKVQIGGTEPHIARAAEVLSRIGADPDPAPAAELPDPTSLACRVAGAALEVLRGERPAAQLARWTSAQVYDQLVTRERVMNGSRTGVRRSAARRVGIRRVRLVRLGAASAEATVVLHDGNRVRAAALRLEGRRGAWRVTCLELG